MPLQGGKAGPSRRPRRGCAGHLLGACTTSPGASLTARLRGVPPSSSKSTLTDRRTRRRANCQPQAEQAKRQELLCWVPDLHPGGGRWAHRRDWHLIERPSKPRARAPIRTRPSSPRREPEREHTHEDSEFLHGCRCGCSARCGSARSGRRQGANVRGAGRRGPGGRSPGPSVSAGWRVGEVRGRDARRRGAGARCG